MEKLADALYIVRVFWLVVAENNGCLLPSVGMKVYEV